MFSRDLSINAFIRKPLMCGLAIAALGFMPAQTALGAAAPSTPAAALFGETVVSIPGVPTSSGPAWSGDISWVDGKGNYYLADRTLKGIDVVDASSRYVKTISGDFVGVKLNKAGKVDNDHSGPNGLVVIDSRQEAWTGDGDSTAKVVDLAAGKVAASISTGGKDRADELAYDSKDGVILIANDADNPPFVTFISVQDRSVLGQIRYPDATNGIEQPVYDAANNRFYLAVPQTNQNPGGQIDVLDPLAMKVVNSYAVNDCVPHGLTLGPDQQLLLGCSGDAIKLLGAPAQSQIMDANTGGIVAVVKGIGGSDEVWYNSGDNRYYLAASSMTSDGTRDGKAAPVLGVIDAATHKYLGGMPTAAGAHSVAADPANGRVFIPIPTKGLTMFKSPGLAVGGSVSSALAGIAHSGSFAAYFVTGTGGPIDVRLSYTRGADAAGNRTDNGVGLTVSGPSGLLASVPENRTGTTAYIINSSVEGATYTIQVSNYNPGFDASYTLSLS